MFSHPLTALTLSVAATSAADICAYTSRGCVGSSGCCTGIPSNTCCYWPSNYGWSVKWQNMPWDPAHPSVQQWFGETYGTTTCSSGATGGMGSSSTSGCLSVYDAPSYLPKAAATWRPETSLAAANRREVAKGQGCRVPDVVGFTTSDGKEHKIKVPDGRFDEIISLLEEEEYDALLNL